MTSLSIGLIAGVMVLTAPIAPPQPAPQDANPDTWAIRFGVPSLALPPVAVIAPTELCSRMPIVRAAESAKSWMPMLKGDGRQVDPGIHQPPVNSHPLPECPRR